MPDDALIRTDVHFNQADAQEAAAECARAARLLRDTTSRRRSLAEQTLAAGRGPWREQLLAQMALVDHGSAELETRLRGLADALHHASARARTDQLNREAARTFDLGHLGATPAPR